MTETTRLQLELADALGLIQAVRATARQAAEQAPGKKVRRTLGTIEADLDPLQVAVNELVVSDPSARTRLTGRSRHVRDTSESPHPLDAIDALQLLAADAAHALAQWQVVRRLAKAEGDKPVRALVKRALPLAQVHLALALDAVDRTAKREAKAHQAAGS